MTTPPTVTASFADGAALKDKKSITCTLKDDFSGVASFEATIDGQWILFEQNTMNSTVTHHFDGTRIKYEGGKHELVLTVKDNRGNSTTLRRSFTR